MAVKIDIDINPVFIKNLEKKILKRADDTLDELLKDIKGAAVVPRNLGDLQDDAFTTDAHFIDDSTAEARLVYDKPYARRLYFSEGYNFQKGHNQNAQDHWMDDYLEDGANADFVPNTFESILKGLLK